MQDPGLREPRALSRRTCLAAAGTALLAGLAGCGGDGNDLDSGGLTPAGGAGETAGRWTRHTGLTADNGRFGRSVALAGGTALVGSNGGAAYVFYIRDGPCERGPARRFGPDVGLAA
jgi:hypothetical protein